MAYKYITENNLYHKQTYMYSEYGGVGFLKEYTDSRRKYLKRQEGLKDTITESDWTWDKSSNVIQDLLRIKETLKTDKQKRKAIDLMNAYTKSFEVRKRVYGRYDNAWKPIRNTEFEDYEAYLLFAECLAISYQCTKCLKYFSCLLKVDDTLLSVQDKLNISLKKALYNIIKSELDIFYQLTEENGIGLEE